MVFFVEINFVAFLTTSCGERVLRSVPPVVKVTYQQANGSQTDVDFIGLKTKLASNIDQNRQAPARDYG